MAVKNTDVVETSQDSGPKDSGTKEKRVQVATALSPEQHERLLALRWDKRHERLADTLREAVAEYLDRHAPQA